MELIIADWIFIIKLYQFLQFLLHQVQGTTEKYVLMIV